MTNLSVCLRKCDKTLLALETSHRRAPNFRWICTKARTQLLPLSSALNARRAVQSERLVPWREHPTPITRPSDLVAVEGASLVVAALSRT